MIEIWTGTLEAGLDHFRSSEEACYCDASHVRIFAGFWALETNVQDTITCILRGLLDRHGGRYTFLGRS